MKKNQIIKFSDILGQEKAKRAVQQALLKGRIPHAYLFSGIPGIGKTSLGRAIAAYLNCKNRGQGEACGQCSTCKQMERDNYPDLTVILPEGDSIKIKQVREIQDSMRFAPFSGKFRVTIIDQADTMTEEAANAFLKTLEEPPPENLLILNATEPDNLLSTVVSRCQKVAFVPLEAKLIANYLLEEIGVEEKTALVLARLSEGSLGRAIAMAQTDFLERREKWLQCAMDIPSLRPEQLVDVALELSNEKAPGGNSAAKYEIGGLLDLLGVMAMWYRDLLLLRQDGPDELVVNVDLLGQLKNFTRKFKLLQLYESLLVLDQAQRDIRMRRNKALVLERTMLALRELVGEV